MTAPHLCECGCGLPTATSYPDRGRRRPVVRRFLHGHWRRPPEEAAARRKASAKACRQRYPEKQRARNEAWKLQNPVRAKASAKARADRHREKASLHKKLLYAENPGAIKTRTKNWRLANPLKVRAMNSRRRALEKQTQAEKIDFMEILRASNGICGICKKPLDLFGIEFDHIIPLSKGGPHTRENIQATHSCCNRQKGARVA